ncbi:methyl-accepting chemotaxis protein [Piscinibacter gummiphilus]|uniref:Methyl-accepting chemotaxis protein n=1 Tax=Piscinibacter gummiphilus TaxID=946333 RepID=A0ABZ0CQJ3_9BURK|nr:methyl-accepting chemotaxis protein [Piscinibacter gummiphilus]WOB07249.1 methyl-accepting chemotaxis protein [Piscinibacter gummiphilus]
MRTNLPITQREYPIGPDVTLMSTTDCDSRITYCNAAFLQVSGFEREELMGQPHNEVRHPDMPTQAFADMWETLKAGQSWTGLVKNRRKNGDHYWVRANATPVRRNGRVVGYMSVRTTPSRAEIDTAETLYRAFREGHAGNRRFHRGLIVRTGAMAWASALQLMPVRWRLHGTLLAALLTAIALAASFGLGGAALAGFSGATAGMTALLAMWLERQIARPLQSVLKQALEVAAGQPAASADMNRADEIGLILRAINQAGLNLRSLIDDVSEQVSGLQTASGEIAQGNSELSSRTEQAASNLQQTAASMEQMTATVAKNADTARQATVLAGSASDVAAKGGDMVELVVQTMQKISTSSKKIADIIGVIDGIAFQTNILALNAAVEAARAGEQGRGFAVVAAEVRSLAQRSAEAAKEIKSLIGDSVDKVEAGAKLVDDAGRTMEEIVAQVQQVSDLIGGISSSTTEQSTGITQVNAAVGQLDQMTQQNAALVEQSSAAAEGMKWQAHRLVEAIKVYDKTV